jgi:deoxycytidylate deaminase
MRCALKISQVGIVKVVYEFDYKDNDGLARLEQAGIVVRKLDELEEKEEVTRGLVQSTFL